MMIVVRYCDLSDEQKQLLLNGCGPVGGGGWFVPDMVFHEACNRHDFDYLVGGERDLPDGDSSWRLEAEDRFLENMLIEANKQGWWSRWWYKWMAYTYHKATMKFGMGYFKYREKGSPMLVTLELLMAEDRFRKANGEKRPYVVSACRLCKSGVNAEKKGWFA
jgi:hypothetical protein